MDKNTEVKLKKLRQIMRETGGCAVAYSGGVDSTLVLTVAHEVLGERSLAVTALSSTYAQSESKAALDWVEKNKIPYKTIVSEELDIPEFSDNPPDRCYFCKKELFGKVMEVAAANGLGFVADGTGADDVNDHRPGMMAACELNVISPLKDAGLSKTEIRTISDEVYNLPTAHKPAMACLASRFPYGSKITGQKLQQVEALENFLIQKGFDGFRARHHGSIVRLELAGAQIDRMLDKKVRGECVQAAKDLGFSYITLDLEGYRTGSMNEVLET